MADQNQQLIKCIFRLPGCSSNQISVAKFISFLCEFISKCKHPSEEKPCSWLSSLPEQAALQYAMDSLKNDPSKASISHCHSNCNSISFVLSWLPDYGAAVIGTVPPFDSAMAHIDVVGLVWFGLVWFGLVWFYLV